METTKAEALQERRKDTEYLAANLGHELGMALQALIQQHPGLWRSDGAAIERGLGDVADAIRYLADAVRTNPRRE